MYSKHRSEFIGNDLLATTDSAPENGGKANNLGSFNFSEKNIATGFLFFWTTALFGMLHKEYKQVGRDAWEKDNNLLEHNKPRWWGPLDYKSFSYKRWSLYEKLDPGPSFEQFEEK